MSSSLKEVAARAGVSARTVSNVVNGSARVSEQTRQRVQEAIDELGYRPNLAARSLRAGRTGIIGLAIPELHSPYFGELAGLLVDEARRRSWTVIIDQTHGDAEAERRLLTGDGGRVMDGLIISPWALEAQELVTTGRSLPMVLLGERSPQGMADRVAVDNIAAADEATTHLLALGRRRIAAIGLQPHLQNGTAEQRAEGYRRALRRAGVPPRPEWEQTVDSLHRREGARAMAALLDGGAAPDAVFAFTDELALGAMHLAHTRGVRVPEDLAVVGFDDIEDGRFSHPTLTTVSPDKRQIAARALQCLADRIYSPDNEVPASDLTIPHQLLVRGSTSGPQNP
ncbi:MULTISPECIES: LacI family DNA-binding transcriptional regulator [Streptomyces]|uniref:DNA-binding LacI/PurR family transcriptional regulator n=2 Tax=Streptomyces TaxID=1883 RepID=A0A514JVM6_9ACTN|nr:LacI family DNA-binding transcriptional regulator [Streptomyces calvus]MBA8943068.1 DNA-binding LacI/PurR family transcriptional regulator [Streptomyces calvus]MBA8978759.1 DNA-binding LacI/PurR family transcriptional regulator [Streptomyces calvus]MYS31444.1 substrate-binding domain-containing protein [Streptomyces sp. SID7804]QDI71454.1 LacI family transcriptional regulator [Streptomyces calvus]